MFLGQERVASTVTGSDGKPLTVPMTAAFSPADAAALNADPGLGSGYLAAFRPLVGAKGTPIGMVSAARSLAITSKLVRSTFWMTFWTVLILVLPAAAVVVLLVRRIARPLLQISWQFREAAF